jgi:hypothetical protein
VLEVMIENYYVLETKYYYNILWWKIKKCNFYGEKYYNLNNLFCSNKEGKIYDAAILQYPMALEVPLIMNLE